ncbi:MAG TPA: hypothetical protein VHZ95_23225, partial [Polyangiales bacterium]|nr:hypothetical protein [Polyangiales bacterium]
MQRRPTHTLVMLALLCLGSWSVDAPVCAAFAPTVLLIHATSVPRAQSDAVAAMLGTFAELVDPQEYLAACAAERLAPTSEHALTGLAP